MLANYCHRCGQALAAKSRTCGRCGVPRRDPAYGRTPAARFRWVWSHFFRNALLIGAVLCAAMGPLGAARPRERPAYTAACLACLAVAVALHVWHARASRTTGLRR
jgi:hypothetical protein